MPRARRLGVKLEPQFDHLSVSAGGVDVGSTDASYPGSFHLGRPDIAVHEDVGQNGGLGRCVPAVDVVGGIDLGNTYGPCPRERFVETFAPLNPGEDEVARAFQDSVKTQNLRGGQGLFHQIEDGGAVHHRRFEPERETALPSQAA